MGKLSRAVGGLDNLFRAWREVRSQVHKTTWPHVTAEVAAIDAAPLRTLRTIHKQLRESRYAFGPKWGYAKRKSGGSRRGITVHAVSDRIVQRSILNVIHTRSPGLRALLGDIPAALDLPRSFAGAPGRGVPEAIALAVDVIAKGAAAFALSDMKDFFPRVPRAEVVAFLAANVDDAEFVSLFRAALETELANRDEVAEWLELFPLSEVGVAQGSLLSVLVGNLSLRRFDGLLNRGPLTTIRYLDDFLILGPSVRSVDEGFLAAKAELAGLGMACYEPDDGSQKAFRGLTAHGFDFLGCRVHPDGVSPARRARRKLLREVALAVDEGKRHIRGLADPGARRRAESAYAQTLARIDKKVRGWGDAYRFVTNRLAFTQIDSEIDRTIDAFRQWFSHLCASADARARRRMSGVALLADTPPRAAATTGHDPDQS